MTAHRYRFGTDAHRSGHDGWISLSEDDFKSSARRTKDILDMAHHTPDWADDLWRISRAVYLVDRRARRHDSPDHWTRTLELSVAILDLDRWPEQVCTRLSEVLGILTGDTWQLSVHPGAGRLDKSPRLFPLHKAAEISLFSGGLDSTAHVARQSQNGYGRLLLIGNDAGGAGRVQDSIHQIIKRLGRRDVDLKKFAWLPKSGGRRLDSTSRSRGLLFAATAILAAAAHNLPEAAMPENGQLAINPPLTTSRAAACSTRSTHPWFLDQLNALIRDIGGTVAIRNPLFDLTKGQVCRQALEAGMTAEELAQTVSCGNHPANRSAASHCGYCYPCLVRRSGLHHALGYDPTRYQHQLNRLHGTNQLQNLHDLQNWLAEPFTARSIIEDVPLPNDLPLDRATSVIITGQHELNRMLTHAGLARQAA